MWLAVVKAWIIEGSCGGNQLPTISSEFLAYDDRCYMLYCREGGGGMGVLQTCCHHMISGHRGGGIFALVW